MKPRIIMTQTTVAAAARRCGATRFASSTSSVVPAAPTPSPIATKATTASAMPAVRLNSIHAIATAATTPPSARTVIPPTIHGVRRPPMSEPWPRRGRRNCTAWCSATSTPGSSAGSASSTTMTRFIVEVVSTTIAPSADCTRPRRAIPSQPRCAAAFTPVPPSAARTRSRACRARRDPRRRRCNRRHERPDPRESASSAAAGLRAER